MNSRERVIDALNFREPDKVPLDFGGTPSSGISIIGYNKLKKYLGLGGEQAKLYDLMQQIARPEAEMLKQMEADIVLLHRLAPRFNISARKWKPWTLKDGSKCLVPEDYNPVVNSNGDFDIMEGDIAVARMTNGGYYYDFIYNPLAAVEEPEDVDKLKFDEISPEELEYLKGKAESLYKNTEYAIVGAFGGSLVEAGQRSFGYEKFMMDLMINKPMLHRWLEKQTEGYILNLGKYLDAVGGYINAVQFSDDLGTQNGLLLSKALYREMIKPYHKRIYQFVKSHSPQVKVLLHSCGAIFEIIPDLIDAGVDAINPVQISANGMEPEKLKKEYGKDIIFWGGGANMQFTVNNGTIGEIEQEVQRLMEIFMPGGGFIFSQVHNIQENVPPEKITAIFETAKKYRSYKK